jgi:2-amino-4-hydroxy-6-hydroxymethyldihydropteridine diphosphokinase
LVRAYVSLGSNIDRERHIREAVRRLTRRYRCIERSSVYESDPVGFEGDPFYNLVVAFDTEDPLTVLIAFLRGLERDCGRDHSAPRWASRTLDADLLLLGERVAAIEGAEVPRPDILEHAFVLAPLAEIAPRRRHPVLGCTFAELWKELGDGYPPLRRVAWPKGPEGLGAAPAGAPWR